MQFYNVILIFMRVIHDVFSKLYRNHSYKSFSSKNKSYKSFSSKPMSQGFPGGSVVPNLPANAGDMGSIPGSGRSLEKEMAAHSSILAWKIP